MEGLKTKCLKNVSKSFTKLETQTMLDKVIFASHIFMLMLANQSEKKTRSTQYTL